MGTLSTAAANAACDATVGLVDAGAGAGKIRIRESTTTLVDLTLDDPAFGAAAAGVATAANPPFSGTAVATGTADNYQLLDSDDNLVGGGTVSTVAAGTGEMQLDNTSITSGQTVNITALTWTQPTS